jgi:hypothetical protein
MLALCCPASAIAQPKLTFDKKEKELVVNLGEQTICHYVFSDSQILRPYFAHLKTPSGISVSRNHPPKAGVDKEDHATMHPGLWLSFGELNGNDYWRNKAITRHKEFSAAPKVEADRGSFAVINEYLSADGRGVIAIERCKVTVEPMKDGYCITLSSELSSGTSDLTFGDQEEMGLGMRLATPIAVDSKLGGRILDSEGRKNGAEIWGKTATWCDYSGPLQGRWVGMTIFASPKNFRTSWCHARDYGLVVLNPFGLNAFTKAKRDDFAAPRGKGVRLGFAVVVHETEREMDYDPGAAFMRYAEQERHASP